LTLDRARETQVFSNREPDAYTSNGGKSVAARALAASIAAIGTRAEAVAARAAAARSRFETQVESRPFKLGLERP